MTDQFILLTHHHVLGQREPEPQPYLHKSQRVFDRLEDAVDALFFKDHRMYFRDVAWDHGFFSHIVNQLLVSARKGMLFQQYAIDKYASVDLPAGLYLYISPKAGSFKKIRWQTGFDLSGFETKGPNGKILLLETKASLKVPDTIKSLGDRRVLKRSYIILPSKSKGISR